MKKKNDKLVRVYTYGVCPTEYWNQNYIERSKSCRKD